MSILPRMSDGICPDVPGSHVVGLRWEEERNPPRHAIEDDPPCRCFVIQWEYKGTPMFVDFKMPYTDLQELEETDWVDWVRDLALNSSEAWEADNGQHVTINRD